MDAAQGEGDSTLKEDEDEVIELPNGATLAVLDILDGESNTNNNSIVTVLEFGSSRMLVTGDAEDERSKKVQAALVGRLQSDRLFPIDVYVVGHHGSETSSSEALISLIKPTFAVISSEEPDGQYKNPNEAVIARLTYAKASIFATYRSGDITVKFNGDGVTLSAAESERLIIDNYRKAA
jgi:competence protein ComEC